MKNLIKLSRYNNGTLLYLFKYFLIGILHQSGENNVKGIIIGIWRYQLQLSIGYSEEVETGDIGHA